MNAPVKSRRLETLQTLVICVSNTENLRQIVRADLFAYGFWMLKDGTLVVFNRRYAPMFYREPGKAWLEVKGSPWYENIEEEENLYHDGHSELQKRRRSIAGMKRLGLIA